jgi:hypothetical protein
VFDWAQFQVARAVVKLHLPLDHDGHPPSYAVITLGKVHEIRIPRRSKGPCARWESLTGTDRTDRGLTGEKRIVTREKIHPRA